MPVLADYKHFAGRHWETGSVHNYYACRGVMAPHTGQPYSEALLMGISGGAVMGYFTFAYEGYDPMCRILTRNTFDPLDTLLERLGVIQNLVHTSRPDHAVRNLTDTLDEGIPAIVWADMFSLPYNAYPQHEAMWAMMPVLVYGYDADADRVSIADRAGVGLSTTTAELAYARGRVKKDKHRILTLDPPQPDKLSSAVQKGIWDTIRLYTEKPPKGSKNNFGLAAYRFWVEQLRNPRARISWEKEYPAGTKMLAGLTSAFNDIMIFGKLGCAERDVYAAFLNEAALILDKPALTGVAAIFRQSAQAWDALATTLLPDEVEPFKETRDLMLTHHDRFTTQGNAALDEIDSIDARLAEIKAQVGRDFPLDAAGVTTMRNTIADAVMAVHDIEQQAVAALQAAMA